MIADPTAPAEENSQPYGHDPQSRLPCLIFFGLIIFHDSISHAESFLEHINASRVEPPGHECVAAGSAISAVDMSMVGDLTENEQPVGVGKYCKTLAGKSECPSINDSKPL